MQYSVTRRCTIAAAVNVAQPVNLDFDGNAAGNITVPIGVSRISQIKVSLSASIVAVASAGVTIGLRLLGTALKQGQQDLTVGGIREDTTSTAGAHIQFAEAYDVAIDVTPGQQVSMNAYQGGVDPGSPEIAVELVFQ